MQSMGERRVCVFCASSSGVKEEYRAEAVKLVARYKIGPMFTPPVVSNPHGPLATLTLSTAGGGANWPGGSYDPETHVAYVSAQSAVTAIGLLPPALSSLTAQTLSTFLA